ncbi:hypothetical protein BDN72DRAFT_454485 [Pluteus cervinus]|uniref:Uncharacterized protein n=1 Tax=Pluteus cervinus TaxID=181527 RepID=A0ACD3BD02_9AGAR|nr:hypothetical protein BDN72DRAFT_454485 [Pluteus cervinus]
MVFISFPSLSTDSRTFVALYSRFMLGIQLFFMSILCCKVSIRAIQHIYRKWTAQVQTTDERSLYPPSLAGPWHIVPVKEPILLTPGNTHSAVRFLWPLAPYSPYSRARFPPTHVVRTRPTWNDYSPILVEVPQEPFLRSSSKLAYSAYDCDYGYFTSNRRQDSRSSMSSGVSSPDYSHLPWSSSFPLLTASYPSRPPLNHFFTIHNYLQRQQKSHESQVRNPRRIPRATSAPNLRIISYKDSTKPKAETSPPQPEQPPPSLVDTVSLKSSDHESNGVNRSTSSNPFSAHPPGLPSGQAESGDFSTSPSTPISVSMDLLAKNCESNHGFVPRSMSLSALRRSLHIPKKIGKQLHI